MSMESRMFRWLAAVALFMTLATQVGNARAQTAPADSSARAPEATPAPTPAATPAPEPSPTPQAAAPSQAATTAPAPATAQASAADSLPPPDGGWPRLIQAPSGATIVLYQPQVMSWKDQRQMVAMCAVSYTPKGSNKSELGAIRLESATSTSVEERMVNFIKVDITSMNFPSLEKAETQEVLNEIRKSLPKDTVLIALDRILAAVDTSLIAPKNVKINTEPPPIFYSTKPAILVQFDGEMIMAPVSGTALKYAVNTNWDFFHDDDAKLYFLRNDTYWLQSADLAKWKPVKELPPSFEKLANDDNWKAVKENIPAKKMKGKMPVVFVSKTPSELILVDGSPKYTKVEGTKLQWMKNTESDVFRYDEKKKQYYVLLSGRWFRTEKLEKGPWVFATTSLPPDFANIPRSHERARVLSSVPGTDEAAQAVLLAQVPRTARVDAKALTAPDVKYDGDPQFKAIEGTSVSYATNTGYDVLKAGDLYYLCFQGVWFSSKTPAGPWVATTKIPAEIYSIPASSPMQHVTYVVVIDDDPDYPTYGYTAGYMGMTVAYGCAMWGTGYYYPPYYHYGGYPVYYGRPVAYGCGATYNPWTGAYGSYQTAYGPYGGVARASTYNPTTGTYARGAMAYGPTGANGYAQAYNPRTGTYAATHQGSNMYGSWGSSKVQRGDNWVQTQRVTDAQGNTKWKAQGSGGGGAAGFHGEQGSGFVGQSGSGDVYAGRDGNVYRKGDDGWQQWGGQGSGWQDVSGGAGAGNRPSQQPSQQPSGGAGTRPSQQPSAGQQPAGGTGNRPSQQPSTGMGAGASQRPSQSPSASQLDRDAAARSQGNQRTKDYGNYQRSGGASSGGGSRGGRGGGGGGRRR
jgi:hypothetical protein